MSGVGDDPVRARNPWWIPRFLGRVPDTVSERSLRLVGAVSLAAYFEHFDQAMLTQAIKHIAADFDVGEGEIGSLLGFVRLGALPALLLVPFADRFGRRRVFLASVIGMSAATVLSGFAPSVGVFVALQMIARMFMVTTTATSFVIVVEELEADHRGWGIGILGAVGAFGVGLSAALFAAIDVLPYGWRAMYMVGVGPILLMPRLRARVIETARFERHREERRADGSGVGESWWRPFARLFSAYPGRTLGVALIGAGASGSAAVAYNFSAFFVQVEHGWAPGQYSLMLLAAGVLGVLGHPIAGRLADSRGRRIVGFGFFTALPFLAVLFYLGPSWSLPLLWIPMVFSLTGGMTVLRALSTELFPTSFRGTAAGYVQLVDTIGAAGALFLVSWLTPEGASTIPAVRGVVFISLVAAGTVLLLPETGRRELEEVSAEV